MPPTFRFVRLSAAVLAVGLCLLAGCGESENTSDAAPGTSTETTAQSLPDELFLSRAPEGTEPIKKLKRSAEQGDEVVVRAVVGGSVNPVVEGRASAMIVDAGLNNTCTIDDDHCPTPWDYCCEPREELTANLATLQVVDGDGRVVAADLSQRLEPLSTLVVRGVVGPRPDAEVLTIQARGIYVEPAGRP